MIVNVRLLGGLRKYSPADSPGQMRMNLPPDSTVADVIGRITNKAGEVAACAINGHARKFDTVIHEGDEVILLNRLGGG